MAIVFVVCLLLFICTVEHSCSTEPVLDPILNIEITEFGFHRDLIYTVQFDDYSANEKCEYMLEQFLPAAIYINRDQLEDLQRLNKLSAIYPKFVDVEAATEKAEPITVLLRGIPKIIGTIKLPIHFRYHAPSDKSTFATVDIVPPKMYLKCPISSEDLFENNEQISNGLMFCQHENSFVNFSPNMEATEISGDCNWRLISVNYQIKNSLSIKIPIGNEKRFPPILYITIILSWVISIWTVFRTRFFPARINRKLEENRILENKIKNN